MEGESPAGGRTGMNGACRSATTHSIYRRTSAGTVVNIISGNYKSECDKICGSNFPATVQDMAVRIIWTTQTWISLKTLNFWLTCSHRNGK